MSRIGKQEIIIPNTLKVEINDKVILSNGKVTKETVIPDNIKVVFENNKILIKRDNDENKTKALHGLTRKLVANNVAGFQKPFQKILQIKGVGFRATLNGNKLVLNVGYSHTVALNIPPQIEVKIDAKSNQILVESQDKLKLGEFAADIRSVRPPEPYKGTGIMYLNEKIIRKAGKSASSGKK
ncbi:MAG: 50S ribosomal protein L6 [Elusimicrobiota bacterium]|jgi:large subunit ribosomal protein L6|nr:50S ribosomal protein L6 [Elusimicrobiota bacterium]